MKSIQEVFDRFPSITRLAVFRTTDEEAYDRNRKWLLQGRTGYWPIADKQQFNGIALLIDAEDGSDVEVWATDNCERLQLHKDKQNRWELGRRDRFSFENLGRTSQVGLPEFVGRKSLGQMVTYVVPRKPQPKISKPDATRQHPFEPNHVYTRQDIHAQFGGQRMSGIVTPTNAPYIFVFSGPAGEQYGYRDDYRRDGTFAYVGEGQVGDMQFRAGNSAIRDHSEAGKDLLLFRGVKGASGYRYVGPVACAGWEEGRGPDRGGNDRKIIIFRLVSLGDESVVTEPEADEPSERKQLSLEEKRRRALAAAKVPTKVTKDVTRNFYERSEAVKDYVLSRAAGICEACEKSAPFRRRNGTPYLEPHHIRRVSDGGPDDPRYVAGICPTCHRRIHHGEDGADWNRRVGDRVSKIEGNS